MSKDFITSTAAAESKSESKAQKDQRVAEWMSRNRGATATALAGVGLLLPALASAQAAGGLVQLSSIQGVTSAQVLANGSLQVTLANGSLMTVAAESVTVLASGQIAVTAAAAANVAAAAAAAAAGALSVLPAIGGAVGGLAAVASIAGGDEASAAAPLPKLTLANVLTTNLTSADAGVTAPADTTSATITIGDVQGRVKVDAEGAWVFDIPDDAQLPQGTQDVVITYLDIDEEEIGSDTVAFAIDTVAPTIALDELPVGAALGTAEAEAPLAVSGTTDAEDGQTVTVTINGKDYTGTVSGGIFSVTVPAADLAALPEGAVTVTANVADAAGNPAASALTSVLADFTAPTIVFDEIAGGELNKVETQSDLIITGRTDAEVGQSVTVTFNGKEYVGLVEAGTGLGPTTAPAPLANTFEVTVPQADLAALPEDTAGVSYSASVSDAAGNAGQTAILDLPANLFGPSLSITPLSIGEVMNIAESEAALTISGSTSNVQTGQVVTVSVNGADYTDEVDAAGAWSVELPVNVVGGFANGATVEISASVSDADGIAATPATASFGVDISAPEIEIVTNSTQDVVNSVEKGTDFTISGRSDAEVGQEVTVLVNGTAAGTTEVTAGGAWVFTIPGALTANASDGDLEIVARVSDENDNPATEATATIRMDFTAPTIVFDEIAGGELNKVETQSDLIITGRTDAEVDQTVTVTFNGKEYTGLVKAGASLGPTTAPAPLANTFEVTVPQADLAALPEDTAGVSYSASVSDAAGNPGQTAILDLPANLFGPSISITAVTGDNLVNATENGAGVSISGATSNVEAGQTVTVSVAGTTITTEVQADGSWLLPAPVNFSADGIVSITADVSDAGGLAAAQASQSVLVDTAAPTVAITSLGAGTDVVLNAAEREAGITLSGTTTAEDNQIVTVAVGNETVEASASGGLWTAFFSAEKLAEAVDVEGTSLDVTADVSDTAGNAAEQATASLDVDTRAPTVTHVVGDELVINKAEKEAGLTLSGQTTAADGETVTVTFLTEAGATVGTAAGTAHSGAYSIVAGAGALAGLPDGATLTLRVTATDAAGNEGTNDSTITTDFTPPAVTLNDLPEFINLEDSSSALTLSGAAETGASVVVSVAGTALAPVTAMGGQWSIPLSAEAIQALPDNSSITVSVVATDAAGNASAPVSGQFTTDFTPPMIELNGPEGALVFGLADLEEDGTLDGVTDLPDGAIVTGELLNASGEVVATKPAPALGGAFEVTFTSQELKDLLEDGQTYTARASGTDAAGNPASSEFNFSTDFTPPSITVTSILAADLLAALDGSADLTISGTSDEIGAIVSVDLDGETYVSGPVTGEAWSVTVPFADIQALPSGAAYTVTATASDAVGNEGTGETTVPGILQIETRADGALNLDDLAAGVNVGLQSFGIAAGTAVTLTVNGGNATTTSVVAGDWSVTLPSSAFAGLAPSASVEIAATATVAGASLTSSETLTAYLPGDYFLVQTAQAAGEITVSVYVPPETDLTNGLSAQFAMAYDPTIATFKANSLVPSAGVFSLANDTDASAGNVSVAFIAATDPGADKPLATFKMTVLDPSKPIELTVTDEANLPASVTEVVLGTSAADTITADEVVTYLIQGGGGDDVIDVTGAATAVIALLADPADNGTDTISGFTTWAESDNSDTLTLGGVDLAALRGTGDSVETLTTGGALGANTGVVNVTTALNDLLAGTIADAAESFTGLAAGDAFYMVATDGTDAALAFVTMTDATTASADILAVLTGVSDVTNFAQDNLLAIDAAGNILA